LAGNESFHLHEYPLISDTELTFEAHAVFTKKVRLLGVFTQPRPIRDVRANLNNFSLFDP